MDDESAQKSNGSHHGSSNGAVSNSDQSAPSDRLLRVYADGIYDLFHFGHARSLEQAKKSFPNAYLLVGCCNDEITHKFKGKTVMTAAERYESLRHCKWVDEVITDAPWVINQEFLDKHNIDYVAHDALPYADASGAGNDVYEFVKKVGRFKETQRTDGISTSDIIMRILKDYNQYVMRNLDRGYTRKELGVSYVKEKRLRVNMRLKKLQEKVKEQQERVGEKIQTVAMHRNEWVDNANRWVVGFLEMFEEGCHKMGTAIRDRLQERLMGQESREMLLNGNDEDDDEEYYYDDDDDEDEYEYVDGEEEYYDDELQCNTNEKDEKKTTLEGNR
ncbi:unnamed protein product [Linum trigynum]|uniref:choline-phosphate cytidylyltransferase n=1 Tax=Linum trigynum TaxID=586398 RepID=A0AAV2C8F9_9ROSI